MQYAPEVGEIQKFLRSRRSVRYFLSQPVPQDLIEEILETATWAPSAHNRQPWRFVVLTEMEAKTHLGDQMGADFRRDLIEDGCSLEEVDHLVARSRNRILEAPVVILLCLDLLEGDIYPDQIRNEAEYIMGVQSVALAGGTLLLSAHAEGLGGVWVCAPLFAPESVREALSLPVNWKPQGMLLLGYPASIPEPRERKPIREVTLFR
jgi:coenzyme F420-0:L-glutamate ligase/coenzyme F420-1:gamma-L-glutamate ligase